VDSPETAKPKLTLAEFRHIMVFSALVTAGMSIFILRDRILSQMLTYASYPELADAGKFLGILCIAGLGLCAGIAFFGRFSRQS
jgi:hypothetical protein